MTSENESETCPVCTSPYVNKIDVEKTEQFGNPVDDLIDVDARDDYVVCRRRTEKTKEVRGSYKTVVVTEHFVHER